MATTTNVQSNYMGKSAGEIIGQAFKEGETLSKGLLRVYENINYELNLRKINYTDGTADYACGFDPAGQIDLSEKKLVPLKFKNDLQVCKEDFRATWSEDLEGASAFNLNLASDIENAIMIEVLGQHAEKIDNQIWNGDSSNTGEFDGFIKLFDADADVIKGTGAVITKNNVLEALIAALEATPVAIRDSNDLKVLVSADVYQAYNFYLVSQGVVNGLGGANMPVTFAGYTLERVSGLAPNTIVIYERDNLIFGTGLLADHNELKVQDEDEINLMTGQVRMKMVYNCAVNYYNSDEIVYYVGLVTP
jgi:hypothetical protein